MNLIKKFIWTIKIRGGTKITGVKGYTHKMTRSGPKQNTNEKVENNN